MFHSIDGLEHGIFYISSIKKDETNNTLIFYLMNGGSIKEAYGSASEMDDAFQEFMNKGLFIEIEDKVFNVIHFSSIGKSELGNDYLVNITIRTGESIIGKFDNEQDRDNLYDAIISTSFGGGGGTPSVSGGKLIQKATKDDFPITGDTECAYVAKDTDKLYYWDATTKEYVEISGGSGGDAVLTEQIISNVTVGAANTGSVFKKDMSFTDFAKKILTKDVAPYITAATFKDKGTNNTVGIREKGVTVSGVDFAVTISAGTMDRSKLKEVNFYVGSTKVKTIAVNTSNHYRFSYTGNITNNTTIKAELVYDGTKTSTKSATYTFIYARFFGKTNIDLDSSNISTFLTSATKTVVKGNGYTGTIDLNNERFVYAYPASYAYLKSIKDGNGFEQIDGYTSQIITISYPTNSDSVQYKVYTLDDPATGTGFKQIYS